MANYTMECERCGLATDYSMHTNLCHRCLVKRVQELETQLIKLSLSIDTHIDITTLEDALDNTGH